MGKVTIALSRIEIDADAAGFGALLCELAAQLRGRMEADDLIDAFISAAATVATDFAENKCTGNLEMCYHCFHTKVEEIYGDLLRAAIEMRREETGGETTLPPSGGTDGLN